MTISVLDPGQLIKTIHQHLDEKPHDWQARRELADLYEEISKDKESVFQRWLVKVEKCPDPPIDTVYPTSWNWWKEPGDPSYATLGKLLGQSSKAYWDIHPDRQSAENALMEEILEGVGYKKAEELLSSEYL